MSRLSCVQNFSCVHRALKSPHVQTFVRSKLPMSRLSCVPTKNSCAQKLVICAFMSRLSCAQKALCPDFRAFKNAYVQTYFWVPKENSCAPKLIILHSCPHYRAFKELYVQTFVRPKRPMSRLFLCSKTDDVY